MASAPIAGLFAVLRGNFLQFDSAVQKTANNFSKFSRKMDAVGTQLTKGLTTTITGMSVAILKSSQILDDALDDIRVTTGKTGDELKKLEGNFDNVFKSLPDDAGKVSSAIGKLNTRLGLTGKPLEDMAKQVLNLSRITKTDLNQNIDNAGALFQQWKISTDQQAGALDYLFKVSQATNTPLNDLLQTTVQLGPAAQAAGFSFQQIAAIIGQFNKAGLDSAKVASGLTVAFKKLSSAGIKDVGGALRQMILDIQKAPNATQAGALGVTLFGKAGLDMGKAIKSGALNVNEFIKSIDASGETINGAYDDTKGLSEILGTLRNQVVLAAKPFEGSLTEAVKKLQPAIETLAKWVNDLAVWFAELSPNIQATIVVVVALAAALGPALIALASFIQIGAGVISFLSATTLGMKAVGFAATALKWAFLLLTSNIGVLIIALVACYKMLQSESFARGIDIIKAKFTELADSFEKGSVVLASTVQKLQGDFERGWQMIGDSFTHAKESLIRLSTEIITGIEDAFLNKWNKVADDFQRGLDVIYDGFVGLKTKLLDHSPVPDIEKGVTDAFSNIEKNMTSSTKKGTENVSNFWDKLSKHTKGKVSEVEKDAKKLKSALENLNLKIDKTGFDAKTDKLNPQAAAIRDALVSKNIPEIKRLAKEFVSNSKDAGKAVKQFGADLDNAKASQDAYIQAQEQLTKTFDGIQRSADQLSGKISPLAEEFKKFFQANDIEGAKRFADLLIKEGKTFEQVDTAIKDSTESIDKMRSLGAQAAKDLIAGFSQFAVALGGPSDAIGAIADGLSKVVDLVKDVKDGTKKLSSFGDTFDTLGKIFSGDATSAEFSQFAQDFGHIASAAGSIINPLLPDGNSQNDVSQGIQGAGAAAGAGIGAAFGGPEGASIGAQIGSALGKIVGGFFGGSEDADTTARKTVEQWIESALQKGTAKFFDENGKLATFDGNVLRNDGQFTQQEGQPNWGDKLNSLGPDGNVWRGLGEGLKQMLGVTEEVGDQIAAILVNTFGSNIDNARLLVQQLGLSFTDMEAALEGAAKRGEISWLEFEGQLQGLADAFQPGLKAVGDIAGAVDELTQSGGRGQAALKGLKDIAVEATQAGIKNFDQLRAHLVASGRFSAEQIGAIFQALKNRNVQTLEQLTNLSDRVAGGVIADMSASGFQFEEVADKAGEIGKGIAEIPDNSEKTITLNVKSTIDANTQGLIDAGVLGNGSGGSAGFKSGLFKKASDISSGQTTLSTGEVVDTSLITGVLPNPSSKGKGKSGPKKPSLTDLQKEQIGQRNTIGELFKNTFGSDILKFTGTEDKFNAKAFQKQLDGMKKSFNGLTKDARGFYSAIAQTLGKANNLSKEVTTQLSYALGSVFKGGINTARTLVAQLNLSLEDVVGSLTEIARNGDITWSQFGAMVEDVNKAFQPGIDGIGNYKGAFEDFVNSSGKGFSSIQDVRDLAVEGIEAGAKTLDDLRAKLIASGKPVAQVDALINAARKHLGDFASATKNLPVDVKNIYDALQNGDGTTLTNLESTALKNGEAASAHFYEILKQAKDLFATYPNELSAIAALTDSTAGLVVSDAVAGGFKFGKGKETPGIDISKAGSTLNGAGAVTSTGEGGSSTKDKSADLKLGNVIFNIDAPTQSDVNELKRLLKNTHDSWLKEAITKTLQELRRGGRAASAVK